ncbi:MAG: integrase [Novosphingobium sp. 17-62-19]|nr:MAG: integrase [Novosphingobium sp. 17-62-19]HQS95104.1 integrase arm-type DNA-binding domain-containing protein [Novosphingobium sp.]
MGPFPGPRLRNFLVLTDTACRKALPAEKERKLFDERGLYLRITPAGSKSWCMKYRFGAKEKKLTLGSYPEITLARARELRDQARREIAMDKDPSIERKKRKAVAAVEALDTFEKVANAWHEQRAKTLNQRYASQIIDRLRENVFRLIGSIPIRQITAPMVLKVIRGVEARGAHEMAHRVRLHISDVFVWAISSGIAETDPAALIRKAVQPTDPKLRPALLKPAEVRTILPATESTGEPYWATLLSSRLLALTAARPGVVRLAERAEFEDLDGDAPIWRIPAVKMKLTRKKKRDSTYEFLVPLSPEAVEAAKAAMQASPSPTLLFPGVGDRRKPISDSTLSKHYREANLRGRHVPHGWRASFSTIMNERAAIAGRTGDREIIDLMLAHMQEGVEPIYNRAAYMPRRREIAQEWAAFLMEGLPPASSLAPKIGD